jgi:UDP-N-acetylmuramoyl-tripeptide--D-alanyl-D-alanine ligase
MITFDQARIATGGRWQGALNSPEAHPAGFSTDSRAVAAGELFIALKGPRFDGHAFVASVAERGAAAAVVQGAVVAPAGFPLLRVADTLRALADLARYARSRTRATVVGVTGSVGKTTTKEMVATLLATRGPVLKSEGNLNNHIGLPLSLLRLRDEDAAVVLEMGMSAPGELRHLTGIARPDVAVITNVAPVHLESFATIDDIARAKAEILEGLEPDGVAVLNRDDPRLRSLGEGLKGEVVWFGLGEGSRVQARAISADTRGLSFELGLSGAAVGIELPMAGAHAVMNFLAAAAVAHRLGVPPADIAGAAAQMRPAARRGRLMELVGDVLLIDDCYNANPVAVEAAMAVLGGHKPRRRVAFLGDMLELGPRALDLHRAVGERIAGSADVLVGMGALAKGFLDGARRGSPDPAGLLSYPDARAAAQAAAEIVRPGDAVLVKASRGMRAEAVVEAIVAHFGMAEA